MVRRGVRGLAASTVLVAACGGGSGEVVVLTAASAGPAIEALDTDPPLAVTAAGSQVVAAQLRAGAPADVVVLADPDVARELEADGLLGAPTPLLGNRLALAAGGPAALDDLLDPDALVVAPLDGVPLRRWTDAALASAVEAGLLPGDGPVRFVEGADTFEDNAGAVLQKVVLGEADLAVVYASDAALVTDDAVVVTPLPAEVQPEITYTVQLAPDASAPARSLVESWLSGDTDAHWRTFGFEPR